VSIYGTRDPRQVVNHGSPLFRDLDVHCFEAREVLFGFSGRLYDELSRVIPKADVVHVHGLYRFACVAACHVSRQHGVPFIIKPHGSLDPFLFRVRRIRKWLPERMLIKPNLAKAAAIHFTARAEMELAAESGLFKPGDGCPVANGVVIPEGIDLGESEAGTPGEFFEAFPRARGKRMLLFLSRLNFKKGLDILAKAVGLLRKQRNDTHLVIAGPDEDQYSQKVKGWLKAEGCLDMATFTGMLDGILKASAYKAADVFVLPSYTENFGMVIAEAMSHGVPVVISNKVNIWREVEEYGAGLVTECDPEATARAINEILDTPGLKEKMAERGKRLVQSLFTWREIGGRTLDLYRSVARVHSTTTQEDKRQAEQKYQRRSAQDWISRSRKGSLSHTQRGSS
jgi:glycosyltransferase involved in cell wall biosynthesis